MKHWLKILFHSLWYSSLVIFIVYIILYSIVGSDVFMNKRHPWVIPSVMWAYCYLLSVYMWHAVLRKKKDKIGNA